MLWMQGASLSGILRIFLFCNLTLLLYTLEQLGDFMKAQEKTANKHKLKPVVINVILALVVMLLALAGYILYLNGSNYAEETAKPIEQALVEAGAVKMCSNGDSGRGVDNKTPYYGSTFKLIKSKTEAIQTIEKAAKETGYNLVHASPTNRGFLDSVADNYINDWSFDETSKTSPYNNLGRGNIKLSVVVCGGGDQNDCDQSRIPTGQSTVGIGVRLP